MCFTAAFDSPRVHQIDTQSNHRKVVFLFVKHERAKQTGSPTRKRGQLRSIHVATDNKHLQRSASYDDILALPENIVGEILNGELHTHPRPTPKHARAASSIGMKVGSAYDHGDNGPGGWWI